MKTLFGIDLRSFAGHRRHREYWYGSHREPEEANRYPEKLVNEIHLMRMFR
jgi:hypothetical protein